MVEAQNSGNCDITLVDAQAVLIAGTKVNRTRLTGHHVMFHVVEGDFPQPRSQRGHVTLQLHLTLGLWVW